MMPNTKDEDLAARVDGRHLVLSGESDRGWHRLQSAAECLQKYAWSYEAGHKTGMIPIGTLVHVALGTWYARERQKQRGEDPDFFVEPMDAVRIIMRRDGVDEQYFPIVQSAYEAYVKEFAPTLTLYEVVGVEDLVEGNLLDMLRPDESEEDRKALERASEFDKSLFRITGHVDLVLRKKSTGGLLGIDFKTTSVASLSKHPQYYSMSGQLLNYQYLIESKYGEPVEMFLLDLIRHSGRGCTPLAKRIPVPARPALREQYVRRAIDIEISIQRVKQEGRPIGEWPKAMSELVCYHRYGPCPFMDRCRYGNSAFSPSWQ